MTREEYGDRVARLEEQAARIEANLAVIVERLERRKDGSR